MTVKDYYDQGYQGLLFLRIDWIKIFFRIDHGVKIHSNHINGKYVEIDQLDDEEMIFHGRKVFYEDTDIRPATKNEITRYKNKLEYLLT